MDKQLAAPLHGMGHPHLFYHLLEKEVLLMQFSPPSLAFQQLFLIAQVACQQLVIVQVHQTAHLPSYQ